MKTGKIKIHILGSTWTITGKHIADDKILNTAEGYTEVSSRNIVYRVYTPLEIKNYSIGNPYRSRNETVRHEIIHAYLYESGLWNDSSMVKGAWAMNEEMVDWIATQLPKIIDTCKEAGALKDD
jgi:hypothetical protein